MYTLIKFFIKNISVGNMYRVMIIKNPRGVVSAPTAGDILNTSSGEGTLLCPFKQ